MTQTVELVVKELESVKLDIKIIQRREARGDHLWRAWCLKTQERCSKNKTSFPKEEETVSGSLSSLIRPILMKLLIRAKEESNNPTRTLKELQTRLWRLQDEDTVRSHSV